MWTELVPNEVWWCDNFLAPDTYDRVLQGFIKSDISVLDGRTRKHAVGETFYNYNVVKLAVRDDKLLIEEVFNKINLVIAKQGDPILDPSSTLGYLQFFAKSFNQDSRYDLHAESKAMFGKYVFVNYLSDEETGELVFPSENGADEFLLVHPDNRKGWEETKITCAKEDNPVRYIGPLTIKPRKNSCALFVTGVAHYVNPVTDGGTRPSLSGWPYASDAYVEWYKKNNS